MRSFAGAVLYISHDEVLLEETADIIIHLEQVRRKTICRSTVSREGYRAYMDKREQQFAHQEQVARFEKADFQKKKDRYLSIYNAVEHAQDSITRKDPSTGRLLKKKMHAVKSMGRRLDKEEENLTQLPEAEWAILPKWEPGIELSRGKVVMDYALDELRVGDKFLSRPGKGVHPGAQRLRQKHADGSHRPDAALPQGHPLHLYAPALRRRGQLQYAAGGVPGSRRRQGERHQGPHLPGQHEVYHG